LKTNAPVSFLPILPLPRRAQLLTKEEENHMKTKKLNVAVAYVGAVVGAGFISGQELVQFFIRFGVWGLIGWLFVAGVVIYGGSKALQNFAEAKYQSFDDLMVNLFGRKIANVAGIVTTGYLLGGMIIMLSGAGTLLAELLSLPLWMGVAMITVAMYFVTVGKAERLFAVSKWLVPALIAGTLAVTFMVLKDVNLASFNIEEVFIVKNPSVLLPNWAISIVLYLGYNILGALVSFISIARNITPEEGREGGYLGGIIVSVLGTLLIASMWFTYAIWQNADLPAVAVVRAVAPNLYAFFAPCMMIAMFTVASNYSLGIALAAEKKTNWSFKTISLLLLVICGFAALAGFSKLLGIIYPVFGIIATVLAIWLIIQKAGSALFPKAGGPKIEGKAP
jgi:uncharacterized membrane protein YkvI